MSEGDWGTLGGGGVRYERGVTAGWGTSAVGEGKKRGVEGGAGLGTNMGGITGSGKYRWWVRLTKIQLALSQSFTISFWVSSLGSLLLSQMHGLPQFFKVCLGLYLSVTVKVCCAPIKYNQAYVSKLNIFGEHFTYQGKPCSFWRCQRGYHQRQRTGTPHPNCSVTSRCSCRYEPLRTWPMRFSPS